MNTYEQKQADRKERLENAAEAAEKRKFDAYKRGDLSEIEIMTENKTYLFASFICDETGCNNLRIYESIFTKEGEPEQCGVHMYNNSADEIVVDLTGISLRKIMQKVELENNSETYLTLYDLIASEIHQWAINYAPERIQAKSITNENGYYYDV